MWHMWESATGSTSCPSRMNSNINLCECTNPSAVPIPGACIADKWGGSVCGRCGSQHPGALCSSSGVNLCPCQTRQGGPGPCSEAAWRRRLCWYMPLFLSSSSFTCPFCLLFHLLTFFYVVNSSSSSFSSSSVFLTLSPSPTSLLLSLLPCFFSFFSLYA